MRSPRAIKAQIRCPNCDTTIVFLVSDHPRFKEAVILALESEVEQLKEKLKQLESTKNIG